jgi:hypothetical protein
MTFASGFTFYHFGGGGDEMGPSFSELETITWTKGGGGIWWKLLRTRNFKKTGGGGDDGFGHIKHSIDFRLHRINSTPQIFVYKNLP